MNEKKHLGFRKVYRSPSTDAIYEQCEWDREHVKAIYPILGDNIIADGKWHDVPPHAEVIGRYRVFDRRFFQAVFARTPNRVFEALGRMDAVDTQDDAEWAVWELSGGGGCAISSTFALTPGQFEHQPAVDKWLWRHGLGLEPKEFYVEGVAYFTDIEPGCLRDAMERLRWLERAFADLNERLEQVGREFWRELQQESDTIVQRLAESVEPDVIIPLPERYPRQGWKRREPVPPDGDSDRSASPSCSPN